MILINENEYIINLLKSKGKLVSPENVPDEFIYDSKNILNDMSLKNENLFIKFFKNLINKINLLRDKLSLISLKFITSDGINKDNILKKYGYKKIDNCYIKKCKSKDGKPCNIIVEIIPVSVNESLSDTFFINQLFMQQQQREVEQQMQLNDLINQQNFQTNQFNDICMMQQMNMCCMGF